MGADLNIVRDFDPYQRNEEPFSVTIVPHVKSRGYLSVPVAPEMAMDPKAISKLS